MNKPKISIIIPVFNSANTIGNILEKLINQSYDNIEIIVINDGSVDESLNIIKKYVSLDKRITLIDQNNSGAGNARNVGINNATGRYIMFIDSDDDISVELILEISKNINDNTDFIMCGMNIKNKRIASKDLYIENKNTIIKYALKSLLAKNLLYGPCCKLFRASIIDENSILFPEDIKYGEDTVFVLTYLPYISNFTVINKVLYEYKYNSTGLAATNSTNIEYRKYRAISLKNILAAGDPSILSMLLAFLLLCRWQASYYKSVYLQGRNG